MDSVEGVEVLLSGHYGIVLGQRRAVCQGGLLQVGSVLKGPVGGSWSWQDLGSMKFSESVEMVQGREQPPH